MKTGGNLYLQERLAKTCRNLLEPARSARVVGENLLKSINATKERPVKTPSGALSLQRRAYNMYIYIYIYIYTYIMHMYIYIYI